MKPQTLLAMQWLRREAMEKRTGSELWAEAILNEKFKNKFEIEYIHHRRRFDFYFPGIMHVVEIDGGYHRAFHQKNKDRKSDEELKSRGFTIHRVNNFDLLGLHVACLKISDALLGRIVQQNKSNDVNRHMTKQKMRHEISLKREKINKQKSKYLGSVSIIIKNN